MIVRLHLNLYFNEMVHNEMKPDAFVFIALLGAFLCISAILGWQFDQFSD